MAKKYTADTFEGAVTGTASGNVAKTGDTMTGDLTIQKSTPVLELNSNSIYPYGRIEFAGSSTQPFEIVGQSNPGGTSLALRGKPSSTMLTAYELKHSLGSSVYNYFPAPLRIGADASANALDDYEEGIYNISWRHISTDYAATTANFGSQVLNECKYVKIGRVVHIFIRFKFNAHPSAWASSSASIFLNNLPFTPIQGTVGGNFSFTWNSDLSSTEQVLWYGGGGHFGQSYTTNSDLIQLSPQGRYTSGYYSYWGDFWSLQANDFPGNDPTGNNKMVGQITYYTNS